jgi:hypothetical protein
MTTATVRGLIPTIYPIRFPRGSTVDSAVKPFKNLRMTVRCQRVLTEKNFGSPKPGSINGRFYDMGNDYTFEEADEAIAHLAEQTRRKYRMGTPEGALLCVQQNANHPDAFAVFGKELDGEVIYWVGPDSPRFHIGPKSCNWSWFHKVFILEEL